jgi:hypothetical protein
MNRRGVELLIDSMTIHTERKPLRRDTEPQQRE